VGDQKVEQKCEKIGQKTARRILQGILQEEMGSFSLRMERKPSVIEAVPGAPPSLKFGKGPAYSSRKRQAHKWLASLPHHDAHDKGGIRCLC